MLILSGCILSFILGAGCVIYTLRLSGGARAETPSAAADLKSQWEEFLNYNGEE